jgi:hypothetical protein
MTPNTLARAVLSILLGVLAMMLRAFRFLITTLKFLWENAKLSHLSRRIPNSCESNRTGSLQPPQQLHTSGPGCGSAPPAMVTSDEKGCA